MELSCPFPGKWSSDLSTLLRGLVRTFTKQLARQGLDGSLTADPSQSSLQPETRTAFVEAVLRLASRAQFSKDRSLSRVACSALGQLAYVAPE